MSEDLQQPPDKDNAMSRIRTREETLRRKKEAYLLQKQGNTIQQIASKLKVSERMAYRYIDEYELNQLRTWRKKFDDALQMSDMDAPLQHFLNILRKQ